MKRVFAIVLALGLVLGLSTVSFAASKTEDISVHRELALVYQSSGKTISSASAADYVPGTVFYFWIENRDGNYNSGDTNITSLNALKDYRIGYGIDDGKNALESVKLVTKEVSTDNSGLNMPSGKNSFIAVTTKDTYSKDSIDLSLNIRISALSDAVLDGGNDNHNFYFDVTLEYGIEMAGDYTSVNSDAPIVDFSEIDTTSPIYLYFDNNVEFAVNAKGQGTLFLKYSDDAEGTIYEKLEEKYPNAWLDYHLFAGNRKTFRREGTLYIPADSITKSGKEAAPYIYEISSNGSLTTPRYSYNRMEERFEIKTKTPGNYVISDTKLKVTDTDASSKPEDASSSSSSGTGTGTGNGNGNIDANNPDTGANDFVGLAVALAAVSLGAIAIAGVRKAKK